jgi:hypothetical protein
MVSVPHFYWRQTDCWVSVYGGDASDGVPFTSIAEQLVLCSIVLLAERILNRVGSASASLLTYRPLRRRQAEPTRAFAKLANPQSTQPLEEGKVFTR